MDRHEEFAVLRLLAEGVIRFPLTVAILGGTVISIINQGEPLVRGDELSLGKVLLTYIILY